ncbi:WD40/YVTN repeat-like-containing domain protein [Moelleriella libera RCEF 2490]|uniref:WD40/YVTN repeat-like-containing domain protein n=1 Tax=Moelleriella libera RCEF 2490 TaxID=1081109 RepID=A0A167XJR5_9HYPO|nr:WD40/YVTN repeat-like-containing domain protein [Moelleriella libera RCEF 2490]
MYTLSNSASYRFPSPQASNSSSSSTYVVDVQQVPGSGTGLATISSDGQLALFDAARLGDGPVATWASGGGALDQATTTRLLRVWGDEGLVCTTTTTTGDEGGMGLWDLRTRSAVCAFKAAQAPISSLACSAASRTMAVGTELQDHTASIHLWDVRSASSGAAPAATAKAHYQDLHSDDVTELQFHPGNAAVLLSGSTDGLVNVYDTRIADEEEVTVQTFNHGASIHRAAFLDGASVAVLSHDEQFAVYDVTEGGDGQQQQQQQEGEAKEGQHFGDLRGRLGCQYVANVLPKTDGSGAILGAGAHENKEQEMYGWERGQMREQAAQERAGGGGWKQATMKRAFY